MEVSLSLHSAGLKTNNEIFRSNQLATTHFELVTHDLISSFLAPELCPTTLRYQTSCALLDPQERAPFVTLYGDGHSNFLRASHD